MPFACFYLPVSGPVPFAHFCVPSTLPSFCFFPVFRLPVCPGPLPFGRFCLPPCPARCPFERPVCPFCRFCLPVWRAGPSASGLLGRRQRASERWQRNSSQTQTVPRVAAHFPRQMGRGALLARAIAAAAVPSFRLLAIRGSSCALSHSHSRTLIRSISRLRAYFGAVFCKNEVCRRRRRRGEKKVGSSYSYLSGPDEDYFGSCVLPKSPLALSSPKTKAPTN